MAKNKCKSQSGRAAGEKEKHDTAAWANIESDKPVSKVTIPSGTQVKNAKEYVDTNEK